MKTVLLVAIAVPAVLSGCMDCSSFFEGKCANYEGVHVRSEVEGTWDTQTLHAAFRDFGEPVFHGQMGSVGNGTFHAILWMVPDLTDPNATEGGTLQVALYSPAGLQPIAPRDVEARAHEEWPFLQGTYDRFVARLAQAGVNTTGEPEIACYCTGD